MEKAITYCYGSGFIEFEGIRFEQRYREDGKPYVRVYGISSLPGHGLERYLLEMGENHDKLNTLHEIREGLRDLFGKED